MTAETEMIDAHPSGEEATSPRGSPRGWLGPGRLAALAVVLALALLILARGLWMPLVGGFLIVDDGVAPADIILPLGGGQERVIYAAELYLEGYAPFFLTTNMPLNLPGVRESYAELVRREATWRGVPEERVLMTPGTVQTTYQEALAVRELLQAEGLQSILLVSSPSHTRRVRLAFREAFAGTDIEIRVVPVENHWYTADTWWQTIDGQRETWSEYLKLVLHIVGYR